MRGAGGKEPGRGVLDVAVVPAPRGAGDVAPRRRVREPRCPAGQGARRLTRMGGGRSAALHGGAKYGRPNRYVAKKKSIPILFLNRNLELFLINDDVCPHKIVTIRHCSGRTEAKVMSLRRSPGQALPSNQPMLGTELQLRHVAPLRVVAGNDAPFKEKYSEIMRIQEFFYA